MVSPRQRLLMRRARDRTIGVAIAPIGTVALLPDPDFRRRVLRCVSHVGLSRRRGGSGSRSRRTVDYAVAAFAVVELVCLRMNSFMRSSACAAYGASGLPVMKPWSAPS